MMLRNSLPEIITDVVPGPKAQAVLKKRQENIPDAVKSIYPCVIARGEGAAFEDVDGNIFLDWVGGVGVLNIGYSHPDVVRAVNAQAEKYFHAMMNIVTHEPYIEVAEIMNRVAPVRGGAKKTMLVNTGAEAVENAVKIAKAYTKRPNVITFSGAFHGRTLLTMAMTANKKYAVGMGPFPDGVYRAEFPYMYRGPEGYSDEQKIEYFYRQLLQVLKYGTLPEFVAAIVIEPVQGEGGFVPAPIEWIKKVRALCDEHGILMIADEVQSGMARSGRLFASEYWTEAGCAPDIVATAKSIAAGIPLGAVTAKREIFEAAPVGTIGGTFCGNVMACEAAKQVFKAIERDNLTARALEIGKKVSDAFREMEKKYPIIGDVRGIGSMLGVEFVTDKNTKEPNAAAVNAIVQSCVQKGLIVENAGADGNVIRFLCPLVVTDEQLDAGLAIFERAVAENC